MKTRFFFTMCITMTLLAACQAAAIPPPTDLPTSTPEPSNTPLPTSTPAPTNTPVPPTPTITATPTPNIIQVALEDKFNDISFDGSFNGDLWHQTESDQGATCIITQKEGFLILSQTAGLKSSSCSLNSKQSANWLLTDLGQIEARLKLTSKEGEEHANINISLISNDTTDSTSSGTGTNWFMSCHTNKWSNDPPYMNCWTPKWDSPPNPGGVRASFNTWHTFRMVIDPETVTFRFYMDGLYYASYTPPEAAELKDDSFHLEIGLFNSPKTSASGYVKDVYIGPKP